MEDILSGTMPTEVFKALVDVNDSLTNAEISAQFKEAFIKINSEAIQAIWNWRRPGSMRGVEDDRINAILLRHLKEAGYL